MMNDQIAERELALEEEDRLPWLEAVDSDDKPGIAPGKLLGLAGAAAIALSVFAGGYYLLKGKNGGAKDNTVIEASADPYKAKPDDQGGMKVEGQGDASYAASQGAEATGKVDAGAKPEAPVAGTKAPAQAAAAPVAAGATATAALGAAKPAPANPNAAAAPAPAPVAAAPAAPGTGLIQLGAYNSAASADAAYNALVSHHGVLKGLAKSIVPAAVNGATMYRLRVAAGGNASGVCAKVKAGGANCMVVK